jgi:hypothetical protein
MPDLLLSILVVVVVEVVSRSQLGSSFDVFLHQVGQ